MLKRSQAVIKVKVEEEKTQNKAKNFSIDQSDAAA